MDPSVGQVFNTNTFRQDVLKINNYYERIGYGGQVPTHVKDINLNAQTGALTLTIQEGLVVSRSSSAAIRSCLRRLAAAPHPQAGSIYSDAVRDADYKALQKLYEDTFHLEVGNFEGGIVPSSINLKAGTADVKYDIYVARIARGRRSPATRGRRTRSSAASCASARAWCSTPTRSNTTMSDSTR